LRIISGEFGGRRIETPVGRGTRPTRDAVREAWFNVLRDRLPGSCVLDLFAGSGALGLEALSRGASTVCFVESNRQVCDVLRRNIAKLGAGTRCEVRCTDAFRVIEESRRGKGSGWDIVLADPPYAGHEASRLVSGFGRSPFASILCMEHALGTTFPHEPYWYREYGETALSIFVDRTEGAAANE
jgi:16S rRNA (guanine966-N2)-methyltransferase